MKTIILYMIIGFAAQMIDGSLGMAYGVSCRSFLRAATPLPAPVVSAVIHCAEIPASLASGLSHMRIGNVNKQLLKRLLIPGVIGGVLGAWFLTGLGEKLEPVIDLYLICMGIVILIRAFGRGPHTRPTNGGTVVLGLLGGFLDAAGGGGWGPVVTSTMLASGEDAKKTVGTVNAAEFLITVAETVSFSLFLGSFREHGSIILGLIIGGVIAAPIAAHICKKIPARPLMILIGLVVIALNLYQLIAMFH